MVRDIFFRFMTSASLRQITRKKLSLTQLDTREKLSTAPDPIEKAPPLREAPCFYILHTGRTYLKNRAQSW